MTQTTLPGPMPMATLSDGTPERIAALQHQLRRLGVDGYLAYATGSGESSGTVRYLTGWMPSTSEVLLYVPADGVPTLISADKNRARAFAGVVGNRCRVIKTGNLITSLAQLISELPSAAKIGCAGWCDLTVGRQNELTRTLAGHSTIDLEPVVTALRSRRSDLEVELHRAATEVADAMVARAMELAAEPDVTGTDIMAEVEVTGRRLGADRAGCWLALGSRPAETYFETFELAPRLERGDRLQIGTTVLWGGRFSQVLRIGVLGDPSAELVEMAEQLIEAQDAALDAMRIGEPVTGIGDALEARIDRLCPYPRAQDPFRFQSCHALGASYSEPWSAPFLAADRDPTSDHLAPLIEPNQTYEIHPNFTSADLGHVCAGDVAVVTPTGAEWMSHTPRGLLRIA
ncbi:MAG TPA: M24 family metallopeptidase [Microlunatus sp.]